VAYFEKFLENRPSILPGPDAVNQLGARVLEFIFHIHRNEEGGKPTYTAHALLRPVTLYRKLNIPGVNC